MKYDPTGKKKLFIAIRKDSALRILGEYSLVIARKIGLPPNGSTIGNSALKIRNGLFAASAMTSLLGRLASADLLAALEKREFLARVRADFAGGVRSGVNGTPTFFINGQRHDSPIRVFGLIAAIEAASQSK